jgi:peptidoglycan/xylan/chitin deacetylase (PgdA/CDA1 family)
MHDVLVLCYHAVSPTWKAALSVTPENLEAQLQTLVRNGWQGATFAEVVDGPPHPRTLVVTFDDAFLSVLKHAHPILSKLGLPGTVFAPTVFMDARQRLAWPGIDNWADTQWDEELQSMRWGDLKELVDDGWEVGSHTRTHPHLTQLDDQAAYQELVQSRSECRAQLDRDCTTVAYPYGDVDARIAGLAAEAGYSGGACMSSNLRPMGAHRLPRVGIYHDDQIWRFTLKANAVIRRLRATRLWA